MEWMDALGVTVCGSFLWTVGLSTCITDLGFNAPESTTRPLLRHPVSPFFDLDLAG